MTTEEIKNNKTEKPEDAGKAGVENMPEADLDEFIAKIKEKIAEHTEEHKILTKTGIEGLADSYEPSKEDAEQAIKERAGGFDKFKIFVREKFFSGKNNEKKDRTYIELADKYIEEEIKELEQDGGLVKNKKIEEDKKEEIIGKEIKKRESDLEKNKKTGEANLEAVKGLGKISPEKIGKWQADFKNEQVKLEELILEKKEEEVRFKENKGEEAREIADKLSLNERIEKFKGPAENKLEKLNDLIIEYEKCHSLVYDEKKKYKTEVNENEKALRGLKGEDFPTTEMRVEVTELLKEANVNLKKLEDTQALLKSRLDKMRDEKKKKEVFLERLNKIGKTGKELEAEKKEKREKQEEEKKKKEEAEKAKAEEERNKNGNEQAGVNTTETAPEGEEDTDSDDIEEFIKKEEEKKPEATAGKKEENKESQTFPEFMNNEDKIRFEFKLQGYKLPFEGWIVRLRGVKFFSRFGIKESKINNLMKKVFKEINSKEQIISAKEMINHITTVIVNRDRQIGDEKAKKEAEAIVIEIIDKKI